MVTQFKKPLFFNNSFKQTPSTFSWHYRVKGPKTSGNIKLKWKKVDGDWVINKLNYADTKGQVYSLVDEVLLKTSFQSEQPFNRQLLQNALDHLIEKKEGYLTLRRSQTYNDYLHVNIASDKNGSFYFHILCRNGCAKGDNEFCSLLKPIESSKEELVKMFTLYAYGSDTHI